MAAPSRCFLPPPLVSGVTSLLLACNAPITGGQTGDGSGVIDPTGPEDPTTADIATVALPCENDAEAIALDEETPLGFSAEAVLAFAEGTFDSEIQWLDDELNGLGYAPEDRAGLELTITARGDAASYLEPATVEDEAAYGCEPALAVPVTVTLETAGGALSETFATELVATTLDLAKFTVKLEAARLSGSLSLVGAPPDVELAHVTLAGLVSPLGTLGTVSVATTGDEAAGFELLAARWPAESCGDALGHGAPGLSIDAEDDIGGLRFSDAIERLVAESPVPLRWEDQTESALRLALSALGPVCAIDAGSRFGVNGTVDVEFQTEDGTLDGTVRGTLGTYPDPGGQGATVDLFAEWTATPDTFEERIALQGLRVDHYETVSLSLGLWLAGDQAVSGSVNVWGTEPGCGVVPPEDEVPPSCGGMPVLGGGLGEVLVETAIDDTAER